MFDSFLKIKTRVWTAWTRPFVVSAPPSAGGIKPWHVTPHPPLSNQPPPPLMVDFRICLHGECLPLFLGHSCQPESSPHSLRVFFWLLLSRAKVEAGTVWADLQSQSSAVGLDTRQDTPIWLGLGLLQTCWKGLKAVVGLVFQCKFDIFNFSIFFPA